MKAERTKVRRTNASNLTVGDMAEASSRLARRLLPECPIIVVSQSGAAELPPSSISSDNVGQKAFGLAALPRAWTLPFFSVSTDLFRDFSARPDGRENLLAQWNKPIMEAAKQVGIKPNDEVLVRSSGRAEGMEERGKFYSAPGIMHNIGAALRKCLEQLASDPDLRDQDIPLLIQKRCSPAEAKGHLSNERHCYEEIRDWMGQFDAINPSRDLSLRSILGIGERSFPQI